MIRPLRDTDLPALKRLHAESGFAYELPTLIECAYVVTDENDKPIQIAIAERSIQLYLLAEKSHPLAMMEGIRQLHEALAMDLRAKGYRSADAYLPPLIEKQFGRRLMKSFGWLKNWTSYCFHF